MRTTLKIAVLIGFIFAPLVAHAAIGPRETPHQSKQIANPNRPLAPGKIVVRAAHRVGTVLELSVSCGRKTQIVSFSAIDKRYCNAQRKCATTLLPVVVKECFLNPVSASRR